MSGRPEPVPRMIRPRQLKHDYYPMVVVTDELVLVETSGAIYGVDELPQIMAAQPRSLVVGQNMGRYLVQLDHYFADDPLWQFRISPVESSPIYAPTGKAMRAVGAVVGFFGWRGVRKQAGTYHYPLDPAVFCRTSIGEIDERTDIPDLQKLLAWGTEVRDFCRTHGLQVKPSAGGLAGQLLKHPGFYPVPRRRVPSCVNERAREKQPGNYYRLHVAAQRVHFGAVYLDMANAHHHAASGLQFPDANSLHAYGHSGTGTPRPWAPLGSPRFMEAIGLPGLFHVRMSAPHTRGDSFPIPCMETHGTHDAWIYSNEIPTIIAGGGKFDCIYSAYVSHSVETGLNTYARWALEQIASGRWSKKWLKPVLHSTYGLLAARPNVLQMGFKRATGGRRETFVVGNELLEVIVKGPKRAFQSRTVNVLHRGMIEAEIRLQVLALARELQSGGGDVLSIYADSMFVRLGQIPILPAPWIVKHNATSLRFLSATHFQSREITRLPGVPRYMQAGFLQRGAKRPPDMIRLAGITNRAPEPGEE